MTCHMPCLLFYGTYLILEGVYGPHALPKHARRAVYSILFGMKSKYNILTHVQNYRTVRTVPVGTRIVQECINTANRLTTLISFLS